MLHASNPIILEEKVISTLTQLKQKANVFCALLCTDNHTMATVYDQGKWWLINHDLFTNLEITDVNSTLIIEENNGRGLS